MQQAQIAFTALGQTLVVEQHAVDGAIIDAIAVVVDRIGAGVGIVIVPRQHHDDVRVGLHHLVEDRGRDRSTAAGGLQVLVKVDDHLAFGVFGDHRVHPVVLGLLGAPAHGQHQQIDTVGRDQVVLASELTLGIHIGPTEPRVGGVAAHREGLVHGGVVLGQVAHVVVAGQQRVGQLRVIEQLVGRRGVRPLVHAGAADSRAGRQPGVPVGIVGRIGGSAGLPQTRIGLVDHIAGVHDVLQVQVVALRDQELVDRQLVAEVVLAAAAQVVVGVVVLGVGLPAEGEVVLTARRGRRVVVGDGGLPRGGSDRGVAR